MRTVLQNALDLVLPRECGGCDAVGTLWCAHCDAALTDPLLVIRPRVDPGVPCWALGTYSGPRRGAVLALKERNRHDLADPLGRALAHAVSRLRMLGEIDPPELSRLVLLAAPTRARAARRRGGDHVQRCATVAARALVDEFVSVPSVLRMRRGVRDSVGLTASQRKETVAGRIAVQPARGASRGRRYAAYGDPRSPRDTAVLLIDDVLTTGATAAESVRVLRDSGVRVDGVLVVAAVR